MVRPCYLVVDREQFGSISTRKLVIETAKFNVITAYSAHEALATAAKFPNLDGAVIDAGMRDMPCAELIVKLRELLPAASLVVVGDTNLHPCPGATRQVDSFDPKRLLGILQELQPTEAKAIDVREQELDLEDRKQEK